MHAHKYCAKIKKMKISIEKKTKEFAPINAISDIERAAARMKSYTGSAVLVFFLFGTF
jgi:hypothetical protein